MNEFGVLGTKDCVICSALYHFTLLVKRLCQSPNCRLQKVRGFHCTGANTVGICHQIYNHSF